MTSRSGLSASELPARSYRPDVDGLRSLAILSVVLFHAGVKQLSGGFTGVDVFFVISGYLIGGHISSELAAGIFRFSNFYRNRAKRILPALYVVLGATLILGLFLLSPSEMRDLALYTFSTVASVSNVVLWHSLGYFAPSAELNPLLMTWSLGVEEQFYLIVPVLLVLIAKFRPRLDLYLIGLLSALSFAASIYQVHYSPNSAFYLLTSRTWELGVGVGLALFEVKQRRASAVQTPFALNLKAYAGLVLIVFPFFLLNSTIAFPGPAALPSVAGAALLLSSRGAWVNRRLLSLPFLVFIGRVSYSFYLVHWPVLTFLRIVAGHPLTEFWGLLALLFSFGVATLSYYFVERPFRSSRLEAGALLWRYGAFSLALLVLCSVFYSTGGLPGRYPRAATLDQLAAVNAGDHHDVCLTEDGTSSPNLSEACTGSQTPGRHIALWGDSHASAMASALRSTSAKQGYFMEEYARTACPPLDGTGRSYRSRPAALGECIRFNDAVLRRLLANPQVEVVLLDAFWQAAFDPSFTDEGKLSSPSHGAASPTHAETEVLLQASLTKTVRKLLNAGKQVIVVGDSPVFEIDPMVRMRTSAIPTRFRLSSWMNGGSSFVDSGSDRAYDYNPQENAGRLLLQKTVLAIPGARFFDIRSRLCDTPDRCIYRSGDTPLFVDTNHLSPMGSQKVLEGWKIAER